MEERVLYIDKTRLRIANWLFRGGKLMIILSFPYFFWRMAHTDAPITEAWIGKTIAQLMVPGFLAFFIGERMIERLYRCPECNEDLLNEKTFSARMYEPPRYCYRCGTKITVCIEKKRIDKNREG